MKNSFNWFLAIMFAVSVALMGVRVANAGESRQSQEREAQREAIYDQGYEDGFNDAPDADIAYEDGFSEGFREGAEAAANYVWEAAWAPTAEDSLCILEDYFNGECSREDALEALEILFDYISDYETAIRDLRNGAANIG